MTEYHAYNSGYDDGYETALDDAQAEILGVIDAALPKCHGVCIWLRGQICEALKSQ